MALSLGFKPLTSSWNFNSLKFNSTLLFKVSFSYSHVCSTMLCKAILIQWFIVHWAWIPWKPSPLFSPLLPLVRPLCSTGLCWFYIRITETYIVTYICVKLKGHKSVGKKQDLSLETMLIYLPWFISSCMHVFLQIWTLFFFMVEKKTFICYTYYISFIHSCVSG